MLNYVTKYFFFEFIETFSQIVDFARSPIYGINQTIPSVVDRLAFLMWSSHPALTPYI